WEPDWDLEMMRPGQPEAAVCSISISQRNLRHVFLLAGSKHLCQVLCAVAHTAPCAGTWDKFLDVNCIRQLGSRNRGTRRAAGTPTHRYGSGSDPWHPCF